MNVSSARSGDELQVGPVRDLQLLRSHLLLQLASMCG